MIMEANEIIKLMGFLYLIIGFSFILNKKHYLSVFKDMVKNKTFMFYGWIFASILWFILLTYYNSYTISKEWLVTLFWLLSLIKWITIMLFPKFFEKIANFFINKKYFDLISFIVIFLWLIFMYFWYIVI